MKKITALLLLLLASLGYSQVKGYTFAQSNGTYVSLEGGNFLGTTTTDTEFFADPNNPAGAKSFFYGLGLSIAKKIIESHLGSIDVKSGENKKTEFIVTLPKA